LVFVLVFWVLLGCIPLCLFGVSQLVVVKDSASATNGIEPGLSWDRVLIPRALVAVWQRSRVDLRTTLGLFVGSGVDLRTTFGLLEESNLIE